MQIFYWRGLIEISFAQIKTNTGTSFSDCKYNIDDGVYKVWKGLYINIQPELF